MDLTKLNVTAASESGTKMEVLHPTTGVPTGVTITLVGIDSKIYQDAQHKINNKRMKSSFRRAGVRFQVTSEEIEQETIELLARCTLDWEDVDWGGKSLPFTYENAKMIYSELAWLREQCAAFIEDRGNFLQN